MPPNWVDFGGWDENVGQREAREGEALDIGAILAVGKSVESTAQNLKSARVTQLVVHSLHNLRACEFESRKLEQLSFSSVGRGNLYIGHDGYRKVS